jgi:hypothetical protein
VNPRIAWDGGYNARAKVGKAIEISKTAGYKSEDIFVFVIYNYVPAYKEMKKKLEACRQWRVRVIDCRYRPLDWTEDGYKPEPKPQRKGEYYLHDGWTDRQVRGFRRKVRRQNIAILLGLPGGWYIEGCESRKVVVSGTCSSSKVAKSQTIEVRPPGPWRNLQGTALPL